MEAWTTLLNALGMLRRWYMINSCSSFSVINTCVDSFIFSVLLWKRVIKVGECLLSLELQLLDKRSPQGPFNWSLVECGKEQLLEVSSKPDWNEFIMVFFSIGWKSRDGVPKLVDDYLNGKLKVDEFVTQTLPLDEINTTFELMHQGKRYYYIAALFNVFTNVSIHSKL